MNRALLLTFAVLLFFTVSTFAQSTPADTDLAAHDDGPTLLFFFCLLGIAMFLAMLAGTALMACFLIALFSLVSAGLFSTALLVGLHRRSVAAGFRTLVLLTCELAGLFTGGVALWLVNNMFDLKWNNGTTLLAGAFGGAIGGLGLALIIFALLRVFFRYCRQRIALVYQD